MVSKQIPTPRRLVWVGLISLFLLAGCGSETAAPTHSTLDLRSVSPSVPASFVGHEKPLPRFAAEHPGMLPSYRLPSERRTAGKADAYAAQRAESPEWYSITIPPSDVSAKVQGMIEWEPMQALLMAAAGISLPDAVDQGIAEMTFATVRDAGVDTYLLYSNSDHKQVIVSKLMALGATDADFARVKWLSMPNDSMWMMDYGPFPVRNSSGDIAFVDFRYYDARVDDDAVPTRLGAGAFGTDTFRMPLDFEGGNLQVDTQGTCYTTQGVLWYNTATQAQIEETMKRYLGCKQVVIMAPLQDEGTSHVDMFFKLVDDHTAVLGAYTTKQDAVNKELMDANRDLLEDVQLPDGVPITVHRIYQPSNGTCGKGGTPGSNPIVACDTSSDCPLGFQCYQRQDWRTYINSTFVKGPKGSVNLWPNFSVQPEKQAAAKAKWESIMPDWTHTGISSDVIITWNGAMHCISRTIPAGNLKPWVPAGQCAGESCAANSVLGYSGSCDVETGCEGPAWLCDLNECDDSLGCGDIKYQGCCEEGKLFYCENNALEMIQCQNQVCGWDNDEGFYNCGSQGEGPATYPIDCPSESCIADCVNKNCGDDGCGGSCGVCSTGSACESGVCSCTSSCSGKNCGDDGCGGSCGDCADGNLCLDGVCTVDTGGCQGLSYSGCCDGGLLRWCENEQPNSLDCGSPDNCGWDSVPGYYNCGFGGDGPSEFPKACIVECVPDCAQKVCGADGCGGLCGTCSDGSMCKDGLCMSEEALCGGLTYKGCCEGSTLNWCDQGVPKTLECTGSCGWDVGAQYYDCGETGAGPAEYPWICGEACTPSCGANVCGEDGCGGSCGECASGSVCEGGQCVCSPDCQGRSCGDDGCGGTCGACGADEVCTDGICVDEAGGCGDVGPSGLCVGTTLVKCVDDLELKSTECPDCCDWSASSMAYECQQCVGCRPNCAGKKCGDDGCGGVCGDCASGEVCQNNLCECVPDCRGRACGDDGCRGSCGECATDLVCSVEGQCVVGGPGFGEVQLGANPETGDSAEGVRETAPSSSGSGCIAAPVSEGKSSTILGLIFFGVLGLYRRRCSLALR